MRHFDVVHTIAIENHDRLVAAGRKRCKRRGGEAAWNDLVEANGPIGAALIALLAPTGPLAGARITESTAYEDDPEPMDDEEAAKAFACIDCGTDTSGANEYYMIHDALWLCVVPDRDGMLCIGCLEARLGRELTGADFKDVPINRLPGQSARLRDRLERR